MLFIAFFVWLYGPLSLYPFIPLSHHPHHPSLHPFPSYPSSLPLILSSLHPPTTHRLSCHSPAHRLRMALGGVLFVLGLEELGCRLGIEVRMGGARRLSI